MEKEGIMGQGREGKARVVKVNQYTERKKKVKK